MSNFNINNVTFFRGFTVTNGQVDISEAEYAEYIDECYPTVQVAGLTFDASRIIQECDPVAFRCGLGDYESEIQSELEDAIDNQDESEIDWEDGKSPNELDALEEQE